MRILVLLSLAFSFAIMSVLALSCDAALLASVFGAGCVLCGSIPLVSVWRRRRRIEAEMSAILGPGWDKDVFDREVKAMIMHGTSSTMAYSDPPRETITPLLSPPQLPLVPTRLIDRVVKCMALSLGYLTLLSVTPMVAETIGPHAAIATGFCGALVFLFAMERVLSKR
ncbi:MAG: hypothetical protein WAT17_02845 [Candidatus Saccharimonadales bacterium]